MGRAEPDIRMVSTIGTFTSNTSYDSVTYDQTRKGFSSPPNKVGDSRSDVTVDTNTTQLGASFGRPGKRHSLSSNSTIFLVPDNGRSYHGPIFDEKGNKLN